MLIALDFDGTYDAARDTFRAIIRCFQSTGHTVYVVTARCNQMDYDPEFKFLEEQYQVKTIFCDGKAKRRYTESLGLFFDVWIDDTPESIVAPSTLTPEQLLEWRKANRAA